MRVATDRVKVLSFTMVLAGRRANGVPTTPGARGDAHGDLGNSQVRSSPGAACQRRAH